MHLGEIANTALSPSALFHLFTDFIIEYNILSDCAFIMNPNGVGVPTRRISDEIAMEIFNGDVERIQGLFFDVRRLNDAPPAALSLGNISASAGGYTDRDAKSILGSTSTYTTSRTRVMISPISA